MLPGRRWPVSRIAERPSLVAPLDRHLKRVSRLRRVEANACHYHREHLPLSDGHATWKEEEHARPVRSVHLGRDLRLARFGIDRYFHVHRQSAQLAAACHVEGEGGVLRRLGRGVCEVKGLEWLRRREDEILCGTILGCRGATGGSLRELGSRFGYLVAHWR